MTKLDIPFDFYRAVSAVLQIMAAYNSSSFLCVKDVSCQVQEASFAAVSRDDKEK